VDRQGQIYFSDLETIWKIDTAGKLSVFRAGVGGKHTHELNLDEGGNLYGEDLSYEPSTQRYTSALWKMTPAGGFTYILAPTSSPPMGMSIWRDRDGNTYSAHWKSNAEHETLLLKRTSEGKVTTLLGSAETVRNFRQDVLYSVGGLVFGADGSLYVADGAIVRKVATSGAVTTLAHIAPERPTQGSAGKSSDAPASSASVRLLGLAVDPQGNVFAADDDNRRVLKVTPNGQVTTILRAEPPWSPSGLAYSNNSLFILEFGTTTTSTLAPRVRKLSPDGTVTLIASVADMKASTPPRENSGDDHAGNAAEVRGKAPYALIGAGFFVLTIIIWRVLRKRVE
jgi:hypothetical protein